ncbi:MAG: hypothetical protein KBS78_05255 [Bacteroidales bacterium]|nr:hypothetical protein [Candidatus Cryptobacteroides faecihippi]
MKKAIYLLSMLFIAACTADNLGIEESADKDLKFYASFEGAESTRTHLDEEGNIRWNANDRISIFAGNTANQQYVFDGKTGQRGNSFSPVGSLGTGADLQANYSVYPYAAGNAISADGVISVTLPATQAFVENAFGLNVNTMVAVTESVDDKHLLFKNACGYLKVPLYGEAAVKTITLRGNNGEKIAGAARIEASCDGAPCVTLDDDATSSITIDCGEGVTLGNTQDSATVFCFVVPPVEFSKGITITVTATDGRVYEKSASKSIAVERNKYSKMSPLVFDVPTPFAGLTFLAERSASVTLLKEGNPDPIDLEYRTGSIWMPYTIGKTISLAAGDSVSFRAGVDGNQTFSKDGDNLYKFSINGSTRASGNIMSLLDRSMERTSVTDYCFAKLFFNCYLTTAPELPATTLGRNCYSLMFSTCTHLTTGPVLPARKLAEECYEFMFFNCYNLDYVRMLATDISATRCLYSWLDHIETFGRLGIDHELFDQLSDWAEGDLDKMFAKLSLPANWEVEMFIQ